VRYALAVDPLAFGKLLWPHVEFYDKQREVIESVRDNKETQVPAGNMLGKDFVAAFIALWFFCTRHPVRVVTTSVDGTQLEGVLWGEIRRFLQTAVEPLDSALGGPILVNHLLLRRFMDGQLDGFSYLLGRVAAKGEGMLGHHANPRVDDGLPHTLFIADEASGVDNVSYERATSWAHRILVIGNPFECQNFFYHGVKGGDKPAPLNGHYGRRVIRIRGSDSPNVQLGMLQEAVGDPITNERLIPGVLSYEEYLERRREWDPILQCVGLDGEFYEGAEVKMFPPDWVAYGERLAAKLPKHRKGLAMGVDPAEGGDCTSIAVVDDKGLIYLSSEQTPDTSTITGRVIAVAREYGVAWDRVLLDAGGGGKEHADRLRSQGYNVQTVGFGEAVVPPPSIGLRGLQQIERQERSAMPSKTEELRCIGYYGKSSTQTTEVLDYHWAVYRQILIAALVGNLRRFQYPTMVRGDLCCPLSENRLQSLA